MGAGAMNMLGGACGRFGDYIQSVGVKEGLDCVLFSAIVPRKTRNLALPSLQHWVFEFKVSVAQMTKSIK